MEVPVQNEWLIMRDDITCVISYVKMMSPDFAIRQNRTDFQLHILTRPTKTIIINRSY